MALGSGMLDVLVAIQKVGRGSRVRDTLTQLGHMRASAARTSLMRYLNPNVLYCEFIPSLKLSDSGGTG